MFPLTEREARILAENIRQALDGHQRHNIGGLARNELIKLNKRLKAYASRERARTAERRMKRVEQTS